MVELEFVLEAPEHGRVVAFPSKSFVIGSAEGCQIRFGSALVGPRHAEIVKDTREQWWVRDLLGQGTVLVNGAPVLDERLAAGDRLRVGDHVLLVRSSGISAQSRTQSGDSLAKIRATGELAAGTVIDQRYRIIKRLAVGGMGEVYRASHAELGKALALKVMLPELSGDTEFVSRFKREAIASSRIGHQNIVDISDFGRLPDGRFYFVMEYLDGRTLVSHRKEGAFPVQRVAVVGLQIARALAAAHAVNIVHRDLKPDNVMLVQRPGQQDFVKVLDFGIAKLVNGGPSGAFTAIGSVVGTPQYMAPEQARGTAVDHRADVYSLGLMLHELVSGKQVFDGDSAVEVMGHQLTKTPPPIRSPFGPVPAGLARLITGMIEKNRDYRTASMQLVAEALEPLAASTSPHLLITPTNAPVDPSEHPTALDLKPVRPQTEVSNAPAPWAPAPVEAPDLPAPQKSRTPSIVVGVIVVLILAALVVWSFQSPVHPEVAVAPPAVSAPAPAPVLPAEAPARADVVKVTIESIPSGAEVFEDDVLLGTTPVTLSRATGLTAVLRVASKGFVSMTRKVRFEAETTLRFPLEKDVIKKSKPPRPVPEELKETPY